MQVLLFLFVVFSCSMCLLFFFHVAWSKLLCIKYPLHLIVVIIKPRELSRNTISGLLESQVILNLSTKVKSSLRQG